MTKDLVRTNIEGSHGAWKLIQEWSIAIPKEHQNPRQQGYPTFIL